MQLAKLKFLVVDDVPAMCQLTASLLRNLGVVDIETVHNGAEALRLLQTQRFDCVLSDWNMPVMDGLELLRHIRAHERLAQLPVVMVTAEADRERITLAIASGVSDLLVKPYTAQRLMEKIVGALGGERRAAAPPAAPAAPKSAQPKPTLLVVDDTPDNLRLIADLFEDDYRVRVAQSGQKALTLCTSENPPDLVLLDVMMPGMDGFEVATRMREHPASAHIPVIFVTALTDAASRQRGMHLGAVDFVTKPLEPDVLRLRVQNFMRHISHHLQQQAEYDALLANARLREDVDAMLRHDVKGPLAGLLGLVRELAGDAALNPQQGGKIRLIEQAARQALDTIELSSTVFSIENGNYHAQPQPVDLAALLAQVVALAQAGVAERRIAITLDAHAGTPPARGDSALCHGVFHNLLKNACEAAPRDSSVHVTLWNETPLRVTIANRGAVPPQLRERFFARNVTAGKPGGSGIGTYSAKVLTEAQGGTIEMASDDALNSTTLTVRLPRN